MSAGWDGSVVGVAADDSSVGCGFVDVSAVGLIGESVSSDHNLPDFG